MKRHHSDAQLARSRRNARIVFALVGFIIVNCGVLAILRGRIEYPNWWGGYVFAPFACVLGAAMLVAAVFFPGAFFRRSAKGKSAGGSFAR
jgi:hypothetical protein